MNTQPLKVGLIGLGKMGQNHLRVLSLLKSVSLEFAYDVNADAARLAESYGVPFRSDLEQALKGVQAVVICTPTVTHADYIKRASAHVSNLFIEKPLTDTLESSREISAFVAGKGLNIQVGFIERFNPAVQQLKRVLDKSTKVVSVDFVRTNKLSSRITDVDVVTDLMIHDIDLALYLNGPVTAVSAHGVCEGRMIDFASALLTHKNGRFSRIQASRITDKKMRSIQATCTDMYIDCELLRKEIIISRQSEIQQKDGEPYTITALEETVEVRPQEALLTELQAFVAGCLGEREPGVPNLEDGLTAMQICDQIQKAVWQ
jgi:predicted dehydrogenase